MFFSRRSCRYDLAVLKSGNGELRRSPARMCPADVNRGTNRSLLRSRTRGRGRDLRAHPKTHMRPLRNRQRTAAIVLAASWRSMELRVVGSTIVHRLPHATSVHRRCGDRQSHRDESAHQQQNQQQSGDETMHKPVQTTPRTTCPTSLRCKNLVTFESSTPTRFLVVVQFDGTTGYSRW